MITRNRLTLAAAFVAVLLVACNRVDVPTQPDQPTTPPPTTPVQVSDRIEFRVFGTNLLTPATIKHIDPLNGLTITTSAPPYLATVISTDPSAFVYLEASAFGFSLSTLQVQILVNGKLFREGASIGSSLFAAASGTVRH